MTALEDDLLRDIEGLEKRLLDPHVRADAKQIDTLLAAEFSEFGSSGRIHSRADVLTDLPLEKGVRYRLQNFSARRLSPECILATYRSTRITLGQPREALRSSTWVREDGSWKVSFHQGTPALPRGHSLDTIETERLRLEPPAYSQVPHILNAFGSDPEVTRFLRWRPNKTIGEGQAAMTNRLAAIDAGEEMSWIVYSHEALRSGVHGVVGTVAAWPTDEQHGGGLELGFAFARESWGQGFAVEASKAMIDWVLGFVDASRIWAACDVENVQSVRALEKIGLTWVRTEPQFAVHPNLSDTPRDCHIFERVLPASSS